MPLEDLTGSQTINNLNPAWPLGTDLPDAGDDHLRGIKNVLRNTFPNVAGPVTLTDAEINRGSIPVGSVQAFYQAAAPSGWERVTGMTQTFGLRIIASDGTTGGTGGGTDDPVIMNKVPSHTHPINGSSGAESADHTHPFSGTTGFMNKNAAHGHVINDPGHTHPVPVRGGSQGGPIFAPVHTTYVVPADITSGEALTGVSVGMTDTNHGHAFSGGTGGRSAPHSHAISVTSDANGGAANWTPRYLDMILCRRV